MKQFISVVVCLVLISLVVLPAPSYAQAIVTETEKREKLEIPEAFVPQAGSLVASSVTGQILWEEDAETSWSPVSITKLMAIYLFYQAMDQGKFSLDTIVPVTPDIEELSTYFYISNNEMKQGASYTVAELLELAILASSSAAVLSLIWEMGLTHGQFVDRMNETAMNLGLNDTYYVNAVGATNALMGNFPADGYPMDETNRTTAKDIAALSAHLVNEYPDVLKHTSIVEKTFQKDTEYEETFDTYLNALEGASHGIEGADGLKTGSGGPYGYNFSMTIKRGDMRLIGVLLGVGDWYDHDAPEYRSSMIKAVFDKAFEEYEYRLVLPAGEHLVADRTLITDRDLYDIVPKGSDPGVKIEADRFELDIPNRVYLSGFSAPSVRFIDPVQQAEDERAATMARRRSTKNMISPVVVSAIFGVLLLWGHIDARKRRK